MEIAIYRKMKELKVTLITVTNHLALEQLHENVLTLGEGKWEYTATTFPLVADNASPQDNKLV